MSNKQNYLKFSRDKKKIVYFEYKRIEGFNRFKIFYNKKS